MSERVFSNPQETIERLVETGLTQAQAEALIAVHEELNEAFVVGKGEPPDLDMQSRIKKLLDVGFPEKQAVGVVEAFVNVLRHRFAATKTS